MDELRVAVNAAKEAEKIIMNYWGNPEFDLKEDGSPVTVADKQAEEAIKKTVLKEFPDHAFLGEETGKAGESEFTWITDPIDATMNFMRGNPLFSTEIALMKGDEIVLGVSNMPALGRLMTGQKGRGAFLNGKSIQVSQTTSFEKAFLGFGNPESFHKKGLEKSLHGLINSTWKKRGFGDSFNYHMLSQGSVDIVCEAAVSIWDIAAVSIIVKEAGGMFTELSGGPVGLNTKSCIATNGILHEKALEFF